MCSCIRHIGPFPRYLWLKRRASGPSWLGSWVDSPNHFPCTFFIFLFFPFFLLIFFRHPSCLFFLFTDLHLSLSPACHKPPPPTPLHTRVPHITPYLPPPPMSLLCTSNLPKLIPSPGTLSFLFPSGTATGALTAVEGSFALCLLVQVPPHVHYTPELQLC